MMHDILIEKNMIEYHFVYMYIERCNVWMN